MSYNCDTWKTKELRDLTIPIEALYSGRKDWQPEKEDYPDGTTAIYWSESCKIIGTVNGPMISVNRIAFTGEGSGYILNEIVEPAMSKGSGTLIATRIWEGGESVDRLTVIDGKVDCTPLEL